MSIIDQARSSAAATAQTSKSTVTTVSQVVRALPGGALDLTRGTLATAGRQAYVTLGAGDALVATVTRQREELPAQARRGAAAVAAKARTLTPSATLARVKDVARNQRGRANDAYAKLAVRGEQVATDLRHDPVLVRGIRRADGRVESLANGVTSAAQKVRTRVANQAERETAAITSTPVRATPANKVPTHRTTVRRTPAEEAAVSSTPTHRAAAHTTQIRRAAAKEAAATRKAEAAKRQAAAKKAAATRKATAREAAAKHDAAVQKAAVTRKKNAAARDHAEQVRHTAAVKAAATRKKNAAKV